jgi:uncharacterized membrane protein YbhN (UPF0104 family)
MKERTPGGATNRPSRWRTVARAIIAVLFLGAIVLVLVSQWQEVRPLVARLSVPAVALSAGAVLAGIFGTFLCWRVLVSDMGFRLPLAGAMRVFFLGQLGKYLPGSVWPVVAQMELGRDYKVPPRASGAAVFIFSLMIVGTGLVVAVPILPLLGRSAFEEFWWTALVLPVAIIVAVPAVLNRLIGLALRLARRQPMPRPLSARGIVAAAGWSLFAWLAYGLHLWVLALQMGADGGVRLLFVVTAAFAAAWCIGFLLIVAPAGAGVREAALILLLASVLSAPQATVIAVVSRLLFTLGDLCWCLAATVAERRRRRHALRPGSERQLDTETARRPG